MNLDWVKPLLDLLTKANPVAMAILTALAAFLLFAPGHVLAALGLADWVGQWRGLLGGVFLGGSCVLLYNGITAAVRRAQRPAQPDLNRQIALLGAAELELLQRFVTADRRVLLLTPLEPGLAGLLHAGLVGADRTVFGGYRLSDTAWDRLRPR